MKTTLTLIFAFVLAFSTRAQVLPNDAVVDGKTIGEWSAEWWKWILPISTNGNPDLDTNGMFATVGQPSGDVFLVAYSLGILADATYYTRTFTVPEGKYLFFPLELYEADNVDSIPLSTADLRAQDAAIVDNVNVKDLHATLDGVDIPNLFDHRAISPVFNIFYTNSDNIHTFAFGHPVTGLIDPMVCDGYWLMLAPLTPGPHVLHFGGSFSNAYFFPTDILDYITVVPQSHPPVADASATVGKAVSPNNHSAKVVLNGSRSSDPDNHALTYAWLESGSIIATGVLATNVLAVGSHALSLVVSDGTLNNTNTITVDVITACEAIAELASQLEAVQLPHKKLKPLLGELREACDDFEDGFKRRHDERRDHINHGVRELREFQEEVGEKLHHEDHALADDLIGGAQQIIDAVGHAEHHERGEGDEQDDE